MAIKKTSKTKRETIAGILEIRDQADKLLEKLCPPCPECCPNGKPHWPCNPGEIIVGPSEIGVCPDCFGRGYLIPGEDYIDAES
jgi:hypothetical protein